MQIIKKISCGIFGLGEKKYNMRTQNKGIRWLKSLNSNRQVVSPRGRDENVEYPQDRKDELLEDLHKATEYKIIGGLICTRN